ncbi:MULTISPECIES: TIGR03750 family conjugal transfer protein [Pasteurellaceae]|uniref:TIGR03750 family conjugal transfer protein n=1 Tax=Gallibacterium anatis TaxID=750 RepID=A0A921HC19_9PAST|nr:TIGR03750 family conjugal transfer protein [Gallibacterium anatis]MDK9431194.1 TIGR03750 family conjugal transfer protein [Gallibacterium anatis]WIM80738.1 TIGR03750 family conjugal transfer protein [Gallibacterium anatis]HDX0975814.1 TIGR03750 family conjugal transfer protein [Pasteurella multocida]HJF75059.1 TIGR03750 family conjugal transfer protein [Gallibacterium anatis]
MSTQDDIQFLPTRLNREATVYGGMTVPEFGIAAAIGFAVGLFLGLILWAIGLSWILAPAFAMLMCIIFVLIGKVLFARLKRGKPEAYLNRLIEERMDSLLGGNKFIRRGGFWATRRSSRGLF